MKLHVSEIQEPCQEVHYKVVLHGLELIRSSSRTTIHLVSRDIPFMSIFSYQRSTHKSSTDRSYIKGCQLWTWAYSKGKFKGAKKRFYITQNTFTSSSISTLKYLLQYNHGFNIFSPESHFNLSKVNCISSWSTLQKRRASVCSYYTKNGSST